MSRWQSDVSHGLNNIRTACLPRGRPGFDPRWRHGYLFSFLFYFFWLADFLPFLALTTTLFSSIPFPIQLIFWSINFQIVGDITKPHKYALRTIYYVNATQLILSQEGQKLPAPIQKSVKFAGYIWHDHKGSIESKGKGRRLVCTLFCHARQDSDVTYDFRQAPQSHAPPPPTTRT